LTTLLSSTFLGGSEPDKIYGLTVDAAENVYITGVTTSPDFPVTVGGYDTSFNGDYSDAFVAKLNSMLTAVSAATFLGGTAAKDIYWNDERGSSIVVDSAGSVFVAGETCSATFPVTPGAYDIAFNGGYDAFASKLSNDLSMLIASSYLGGTGEEETGLTSIAIGPEGDVYMAGLTHSSDFPTTPNAYDTSFNGFGDTFISKLDTNLSASPPIPDIKANGSDGPLTISNSADELIITVSLDPVGCDGRNVDWWARGLAPNGDKYWYVYKTGQWVKSSTPIRARGGACKTVLPTEILNRGTMPVGTWLFHFGVDADMNNVLDMGLLHWDKVKVTVTP